MFEFRRKSAKQHLLFGIRHLSPLLTRFNDKIDHFVPHFDVNCKRQLVTGDRVFAGRRAPAPARNSTAAVQSAALFGVGTPKQKAKRVRTTFGEDHQLAVLQQYYNQGRAVAAHRWDKVPSSSSKNSYTVLFLFCSRGRNRTEQEQNRQAVIRF
ncbi:hypothetical protein GPALN_007789 [Globodera pallida]|nr:hypothetical protein GPALN_007789 [Globodera pallida]